MTRETCMTPRRTTVYLAVGLLFFGFLGAIGNAQETSGSVKAVQLTGLKGVKDNTKGTLSVESGKLRRKRYIDSRCRHRRRQSRVCRQDGGHHGYGCTLRRRPRPEFIPHKNRYADR